MRRTLLVITFSVLALAAQAVRARYPHLGSNGRCTTRSVSTVMPAPVLIGDFRALIILANFSDVQFQADAQAVWNDIANKPGYAEHGAMGCVADYFKAQSGGRFNLSFDVVGPVDLPQPMAYYGKDLGGEGHDQHIVEMIRDACQAADSLVDFTHYDWNGDGRVEMVFVLYAGMGQNDLGSSDTVWPQKDFIPSTTFDGVVVSTYACCNEIAGDGTSLSGLGTFCHEFSHCLGLPDLYQPNGDPVFDEWDLMDGGCYANNGWTPVNYSAYEKYLCGWLEPQELTTGTTITSMPCLNDDFKAYLIRSDSNSDEFYILENRQWTGYDTYLPGHGLLITHVKGHRTSWGSYPNTSYSHPIDLIFADNLNYAESESAVETARLERFTSEGRSNYLAHAAYPYEANDSLTATSVPANTLGKPVTAIKETGGLVSFLFMGGTDLTAMPSLPSEAVRPVSVYHLLGRRIDLIRYSDGSVKKVLR